MEDYKEIIKKIEPKLEEALSHLKEELAKVRTDRATPSLVDHVTVECFDQRLPLKQLAAVSCPERRQIVIEPWDKSYLKDILRAIEKASPDLSCLPEEKLIRVTIPPLTEEYRKKLIRNVSEIKEKSRVRVKHNREEVWKEIQEKERAGEITEDDKFRAKDELQKMIDNYNHQIEEVAKKKEKEIME